MGQLQKESRAWDLFPLVGSQEILKQGEMEAAVGIGQEQRQTAIAIARFSVFPLVLVHGVGGPIGTGRGLVGATVPDKTSFGIPGCGVAAGIGTS